MKSFKKILATVLCVIMVFGSAPLSGLVGIDLPDFNLFAPKASAATYSGTCGANLTWSLDTSTGKLIVSGSGAMNNWSSSSYVPWNSYRSYVKTVKISNGVTSLGKYAFDKCSELTSITIPDSVTSIGDYVFYYCTNLTNITIPDSVTSIGQAAFYECSKLTSITIPDSVTSIGWGAFHYCIGLTSVTIPDSVTSIGGYAFAECSDLTSVTISNNVTSIGNYVFCNCVGLTSVTIPDNVTSIGNYAFWGCEDLISVTIGNNVTSIGQYAFAYCDRLKNVTIPDSVINIGDHAFYGCNDFTSVTIGNNVTSIGDYAFAFCDLKSVTIPDSVTSVGDYAFYYCSSLTSVTIPDSVTSIGEFAFYITALYYDSANWDNKVLYIDGWLIEAKESLSGAYVIKVGTKGIADVAFQFCSYLTSITIPDSVTSIGDDAFHECTNLTDVFYMGTGYGWNEISIGKNNSVLENAIIHFDRTCVVWNIDGDKTVVEYNLGDLIVIPNTPIKDGYVFIGWTPDVPTTVDEEYLVFTATWQKKEYIITWNIDGVITTETYGYGTTIKKPANPVKEGYTFIGWINDIPSTMPANNLEFVAEWSINPHTVTWIVDGKKTVDTYNYGDIIVRPADPEKVGYTFNGWGAEIPATVPDKDLTFTAIWKVNNYTVIWNVDSVTTTETYNYGDSIKKPANPVKEGYTFIGWNNDVPATMPANNLEFVAEWSINPHIVTWIVDGKKTVDTYNYGDTLVKPADPEKIGYTFNGWGTEIPATVPDKDLTFTAKWKVNSYTVAWKVDGVITTETYDYGASINKPSTPVKEGYTFVGWNNNIPSTMPANDLEFVAEWSINSHTVTWIVDVKETTDKLNYGDLIVKPENPEKDGYTFTGWTPSVPSTVPDSDLTFIATWKANSYTITWNVSGVTTTEIYDYGALINKPANPVKEGYTFIGWSNSVPVTMPSKNLSFTAQYECISTVSIKNNSGSKTINYGETLKLTANVFDMPAGVKLCWYVDGVKRGEGENFEITFESGSKSVEVKLVDASGNVLKNGSGNEIKDSETVTVKAGFFQKLVAFFKKLFGIGQIIVQSINF